MSNTITFDIRCYGDENARNGFKNELRFLNGEWAYEGEGFSGFRGSIPCACIHTQEWIEFSKRNNSTIGLFTDNYMSEYAEVLTIRNGEVIHNKAYDYYSFEDPWAFGDDYLDLVGEGSTIELEELCRKALKTSRAKESEGCFFE